MSGTLFQEFLRQPPQNPFEPLLKWLDSGGASQGRKYEEVHERLINHFDRKNCLAPESLADETSDQTAKSVFLENIVEQRGVDGGEEARIGR